MTYNLSSALFPVVKMDGWRFSKQAAIGYGWAIVLFPVVTEVMQKSWKKVLLFEIGCAILEVAKTVSGPGFE